MVLEIFFLAIYCTVLSASLLEGLYYLNFSPLSYFKIWERSIGISWPYNYLIGTIALLLFFFLLGMFMNKVFPKFKGIKWYILVSSFIFLLCEGIIAFNKTFLKEMAILGQLSLLFTIIIVFVTFFYSIFYRNLVK